MLVITYGTLKKDFTNHPILEHQTFLGLAAIESHSYKMYEITSHSYPYPAIVSADDGYQIYGELYDVNDRCIAVLDHVEAVAQGLYRKEQVSVIDADGVKHDDVLVYVYNKSIEGCDHVGQCWPKKQLDVMHLGNNVLRSKETKIVQEGARLWDKKNEKWESPVKENLQELEKWAAKRPDVLGGHKNDFWSPDYFESKSYEHEEEGHAYWIINSETKKIISPEFYSITTLAQWASGALTFLGGCKATSEEWASLLKKFV